MPFVSLEGCGDGKRKDIGEVGERREKERDRVFLSSYLPLSANYFYVLFNILMLNGILHQ